MCSLELLARVAASAGNRHGFLFGRTAVTTLTFFMESAHQGSIATLTLHLMAGRAFLLLSLSIAQFAIHKAMVTGLAGFPTQNFNMPIMPKWDRRPLEFSESRIGQFHNCILPLNQGAGQAQAHRQGTQNTQYLPHRNPFPADHTLCFLMTVAFDHVGYNGFEVHYLYPQIVLLTKIPYLIKAVVAGHY